MQTTNDVVFVQLPDIMSDCNRPPHSSQFKAGGLKIKRAGVPLSLQILVLGHGRRWEVPTQPPERFIPKVPQKKNYTHARISLISDKSIGTFFHGQTQNVCKLHHLRKVHPTSSGILNLLVPCEWLVISLKQWLATHLPSLDPSGPSSNAQLHRRAPKKFLARRARTR